MKAAALPVAAAARTFSTDPGRIEDRLARAIIESHPFGGIESLSIKTVWRIVRDLVLAIENWTSVLAGYDGPRKMGIAEAVAWRLLNSTVGDGLAGLRALIGNHLPGGRVARFLLGKLLNEKRARALIRMVLEFAVREMKERFADG